MKKIGLIVTLLCCALFEANSITLSPDAKISLLTCAPGNQIYSYFGHTAIRVHDEANAIDYVFNYGAFSFESDHFIWNFAKGRTDYQLVVQRMSSFLTEYQEDKRSVTELTLNITQQEKQRLYDALVENYKPENRIYRYNHFLDNCATRVRDQFEMAVDGNLKYDQSSDKPMSFRDLIRLYLPNNSWIGLGIHLALGIPTDRPATFSEKMFIPDFLHADMSKAVVMRATGETPLMESSRILVDVKPDEETQSIWSPDIVILAFQLLVLATTIIEYIAKRRWIELDFIIFFIYGMAGILLAFLTFGSALEGTSQNLNLFWAWPTHLLFAFVWLKSSWRKYSSWYLKILAVVVLLFLASMPFVSQGFHWLTIPLCLILLLRSAPLFLKAQNLYQSAQE